jgi:hypothetical protein
VRVPLCVAARRSAWTERHSEVRLAFFSKMVQPDKPTFSHSSPRRILAILDWDFGGSHTLPFADERFEVCWPDFDNDDAVRMKDAEEIYRFQLLIDQLAGSLPIDVELNQLVLSTNWQTLNRETLTPSGKDTCIDDHDSGVEV